jgi:hypothetical protein
VKILFNNLIKHATIQSVNAAANFPVTNLQDNFLELRYQVNETSDSVSVQFEQAITISCIYMGYIGNLEGIRVTAFSNGVAQDIVFDSLHIAEDGVVRIFDTDVLAMFGGGASDYFDDYGGQKYISRHFDPITGIDELKIDYTGTNPFFVGGIAAGLCVDMPPAIGAWEDSYRDNSNSTESAYGQIEPQYIKPLKTFAFTFEAVRYSKFLEIKEKFIEAGNRPVWVTFFEDSEDDYPPGYYQVEMRGQQRSSNNYVFSVRFKEAR